MLITDYMVARDEHGQPLCLVVKDVLMTDCRQGKTALIEKATRKDLVQEFIQEEGDSEFISFPDLPADVAELLASGLSLSIYDAADDMRIDCAIEISTTTKVACK